MLIFFLKSLFFIKFYCETKMTNTLSPSAPNMAELQDRMIRSIRHFSIIRQVRVEDNKFIQEKLNEISEQRGKFRDFVESSITHSLIISTHTSDLIIFAECCDDDNIGNDELLELLRTYLSDARLN